MSAKKGLGRGFSSLVPDEFFDESFDPTAEQDEQISDLRTIKISQIAPDVEQPRRSFDQAALESLASSIREHGILQPIVVVSNNGNYTIVAGERRWRAAQMAGLDKLPALVRTLSDQHKLELSLIENLQRKDLNPLETATAYYKLRDQFNLTLDMIAKRMGVKSVSAVSNKMRLLRLAKPVQLALVNGEITEGQARPLIDLDENVVAELLSQIIKESWSARKIEQWIVQYKKEGKGADEKKSVTKEVNLHQKEVQRIEKQLGMGVQIRTNSKGAGKLTVRFTNADELKKLEELLGGK